MHQEGSARSAYRFRKQTDLDGNDGRVRLDEEIRKLQDVRLPSQNGRVLANLDEHQIQP